MRAAIMIKLARDKLAIQEAVTALEKGEIVAIPTETVYGLAADATNESAVAKIFTTKNRPAHNPIIVHVKNLQDAQKLVQLDDLSLKLAQHFWPGPLTIVAPYIGSSIAPNVMAGLTSLGVRVSAHPVMQDIIQKLGRPLAAPSANASGRVSATSPQIITDTIGDKMPLILADGLCENGVESTIIQSVNGHINLLRHGAISYDALSRFLTSYGDVIHDVSKPKPQDAPQSPGQLLRHYAPRARLRLNAVDIKEGEALLAFGSTQFIAHEHGGFAHDVLPPTHILNLSETGDMDEAAKHLFAYLHKLDAYKPEAIAIMPLPKTGIGQTIHDRLNRACQAQNMT